MGANWISKWETFPSADQKLKLYSTFTHSQDWTGKRTLVIVHGQGEHGGRYQQFLDRLYPSIDAIYCMDHRGHGRSEGLRGHVEKFDQYTDDVALAISRLYETLKQKNENPEIHVLGHSMGGLIVLRLLFQFTRLPIQSASVSAPLLEISAPVPLLKKTLGLLLTRVWGSLQLDSELDARGLSHDPEVIKAYQGDRLVHQKITPLFFSELQAAMKDTLSRNSGLKCPVQFQIPMNDPIVSADRACHYFQSLKHRDKSLKTYPEFFHEPFNEIGKEQVFEDLKQWIQTHSQRSRVSSVI